MVHVYFWEKENIMHGGIHELLIRLVYVCAMLSSGHFFEPGFSFQKQTEKTSRKIGLLEITQKEGTWWNNFINSTWHKACFSFIHYTGRHQKGGIASPFQMDQSKNHTTSWFWRRSGHWIGSKYPRIKPGMCHKVNITSNQDLKFHRVYFFFFIAVPKWQGVARKSYRFLGERCKGLHGRALGTYAKCPEWGNKDTNKVFGSSDAEGATPFRVMFPSFLRNIRVCCRPRRTKKQGQLKLVAAKQVPRKNHKQRSGVRRKTKWLRQWIGIDSTYKML